MPSGKIGFDQLPISCIIGDLPHEREQEQTIFFNLRVAWDFYPCSKSDALSKTLDYVRLVEICQKTAKSGQFRLLETLAVRAVETIVNEFPINWAWVQIKKPADKGFFVVEWEWK